LARPTKQATTKTTQATAAWSFVVRKAEEESAKFSEVSQATRLTYEAKAKQLVSGWDLASACKQSRYVMRAAGLWTMRRQLRRKLREAKALLARGVTGQELAPVREAMWTAKMGEVQALLVRIWEFDGLPWSTFEDPGRRLQDSHKQRAATDAELEKFFAKAGSSKYRHAFLVAEFSGSRGEEFGQGVRVETAKVKGVATLRFFIESAKCDGKKKGLELRGVDVPFPANAAKPVQRRWLELGRLAASGKGGCTVKIEKTASSTAGQLFTRACVDTAKAAGVDMAAYSLRHRFSAQAKQANQGDAVAVALALGHQTTETQRHYGRSKRGKGGISPVQVVGINLGGHAIRGSPTRAGPNYAQKERVALRAVVAASPAAAPPRPRMRL